MECADVSLVGMHARWGRDEWRVFAKGAGSSRYKSCIIKPAAGDDLRAVFATPQDVAEGKRLADSSCARCHGVNGISATKGVPHLAGQRPAYLYRDLRAYQSGRPRR